MQVAADLQALRRLLQREGIDPLDFTVDGGDASAAYGIVGLVGELRRVVRLSTGEQRVYSVDGGRRWLQAVLGDLRQGLLPAGEPLPLRRPDPVAASQPLTARVDGAGMGVAPPEQRIARGHR